MTLPPNGTTGPREREMWVFSPFRLDTVARVLYRNDRPVALTPKQVDTLLVLVREHGQVVERERLMAEVWPETFVEDGGLTRNVSAIRRALGDTGEQFIETVPKRGYRFVAPVTKQLQPTEPPATAPLTVTGTAVPETVMVTAPARAWRHTLILGLAALAMVTGMGIWQRQLPVTDPPIKSLAVLPFRLLSSAESDRYLAVGLADLLTTRLAGLATVSVRPASTTLHLAGVDPVGAGQGLGVDTVVDGTLRRDGDRLRLTVQVIDVVSGAPLYAGSFDERGDGVLEIEASLSNQVLGLLVPRMLASERAAQARRGTADAVALDYYLKGRYALLSRKAAMIDEAIAAFTEATARDPDFALAHGGLASAYALLGGYQFRLPGEVFPLAKAAALRALALDENVAEAYAALGEVAWSFEYDWAAADHAQQRAIRLAPLEPQFRQWRAYYLAALNRPAEAMAEAEQAAWLAPNDYPAAITQGGVAYWTGNFAEALVYCERAATMAGGNPVPLLFRFYSLRALGRIDEARVLFEQIRSAYPDEPIVVSMTAYFEVLDGRRDNARRLLDELAVRARSSYVEPMYLAGGYALAGDWDAARYWLQLARDQRSAMLPMIAVDPVWRPYHGDSPVAGVIMALGLTGRGESRHDAGAAAVPYDR